MSHSKSVKESTKKHHKSVRKEILTLFMIFVLAFLVISLVIQAQNINKLRQVETEHLSEVNTQLSERLDSVLLDVSGLFGIPYSDSKIRSILRKSSDSFDEITRFSNTNYVENLLSYAINDSPYVVRVCLFTTRGDVYSNVSSVLPDYREFIWENINEREWGNNIDYIGVNSWRIGLVNRTILTAVKVLYDYNGSSPLAWLTIDINYDTLENLLLSSTSDAGVLLLYNDTQLFKNGYKDLSDDDLDKIQGESLLMMQDQGTSEGRIRIDGVNYLITAIKSDNTGWILIRFVEEGELLQDLGQLLLREISILLISAFIIFLICYLRITKLMQPLVRLDQTMKDNIKEPLQKVKFSEDEKGSIEDNEIGNAIINYNEMVDRINNYADKTYKSEIMQKNAQLKMLTYQINPHFLYNTLNIISSMAEIENMENIVQITDCISNIFRYSLKGGILTTLQEELEHVQDYILIQKYRFPGKFDVDYDIPEELLQLNVIKFILQPIVENSISHGFYNFLDGGKIILCARLEKETSHLILTVSDNGEGIEKNKLEDIRQSLKDYELIGREESNNGADGMGIMNVNARIVSYYGGNCGLSIDSKVGEGTLVELRLNIVE